MGRIKDSIKIWVLLMWVVPIQDNMVEKLKVQAIFPFFHLLLCGNFNEYFDWSSQIWLRERKLLWSYFIFLLTCFRNWIFKSIFFMFICFCKLLTPILIKKLGIPKKLIMLEFEGIRIPTLFKIILGAKNSIETWWSRGHH